jgi:DNA-binding NarL/FixJ family response regulator
MPLPFSTSQQELIRLLAKGYADSEIGRKMALTDDQLQRAFSGLCAQLGVADRLELILLIWSSYGHVSAYPSK